MKVLAWNIQHGGGNRALVAALTAHDADVMVLSEYWHGPTSGILDQLRFFGWQHAVHSNVSARQNGVAIVSKHPLSRGVGIGDSALGRWSIEASIKGAEFTLIGIYAPLASNEGEPPGTQRLFWRAMHEGVERRSGERLLIVGDFNTCAKGVDGPGVLPCADAFEHLSTLGLLDVWRARNEGLSDYSFVDRRAMSRWRIDHAFVSPALAPAVRTCRYSHAEREQGLSDHSMLIIEID